MQRDIESWRIISKVILKIYKSDRLLFNNIRAVYIKKSELNYRLEKEKSSGCLGVIIQIIIPIIIIIFLGYAWNKIGNNSQFDITTGYNTEIGGFSIIFRD